MLKFVNIGQENPVKRDIQNRKEDFMSFINTAYADSAAGATQQGGGMQLILMPT